MFPTLNSLSKHCPKLLAICVLLLGCNSQKQTQKTGQTPKPKTIQETPTAETSEAEGTVSLPKADKMLLVIIDTLRADRVGAYGYNKPTTPTIDSIAKEGVLFKTLHSASPWTAPSFGSIYTGVSPTVHGAGSMLAKGSRKGTDVLGVTVGGIRKDLPTLAELMPEQMTTAGFVTNAFVSPALGMERGLDHYDHRNNSVHRYRKADEVTGRALKWLEENNDKPFFMLLHYIDPHMGYGPPQKYIDEFAPNKPRRIRVPFTDHASARDGSLNPNSHEKAFISGLYDGEVRYVDDQLKRIVTFLKKKNRLEDTWLIVTSDHGEELFEHGSFEHGHAYEDEVTHVPLIIRAPGGKWHAKEVVKPSVRHVDIPATLLDLLGEPTPDHFEGRSLVPMIEKKDMVDRTAYIEFNLFHGQQCALFDGRYKMVYDIRRNRGFYYDLKTDPKEMTRLSKKEPPYRKLMDALMKHRKQLQAAAKGKKFEAGHLTDEAAEALKSLGYIK